jgi:D-cysteine desulfhydrase family pyridoxal phosphate-dependent enzyme
MTTSIGNLDNQPRAILSHTPTPIDEMPNLARHIGTASLFAKRDDCTGLGMGGNKARQLEFYLGEAVRQNADTVLITGAVQSNFVRTAAAAARKMDMDIHIQLEARVPNPSPLYYHSGNVLLDRIYGATLHSFPEGEDEVGADNNLEAIAEDLRAKGRVPYVIHLGPGHPPRGALGYVVAARELVEQMIETGLSFDEIVVPSGSGATHAGFLFGLRALGCTIPVKGICVRRTKDQQTPRITKRCQEIADLLEMENPVTSSDIDINDDVLAPGYGKMNDAVMEAITLSAHKEGIILDPVYTGRSMAGFLSRARQASSEQNLLFLHTGGQPAIFGYESDLEPMLSDNV